MSDPYKTVSMYLGSPDALAALDELRDQRDGAYAELRTQERVLEELRRERNEARVEIERLKELYARNYAPVRDENEWLAAEVASLQTQNANILQQCGEQTDAALIMQKNWRNCSADYKNARAEVERLKAKLHTEHEGLKWEVDCLRAAIQRHRENVPEYVASSVDRELWAALEVKP